LGVDILFDVEKRFRILSTPSCAGLNALFFEKVFEPLLTCNLFLSICRRKGAGELHTPFLGFS
jgi:hypothetical protein